MAEKQYFVKYLLTSTAYTAVAKYLGLLVSLVITAILSRILSPTDFAVVAIATVFIGFISLITGNGLLPAIVQNKKLTRKDIEHIYSFTIYLGVISSILFVFFSFLIADFYSEYNLLIVCQLLSVNILFSVANIVPNALFFKDKEFKFIAVRTIVINVITGALAIVCALCGMGIYSLLINPILGSFCLYLVSLYFRPVRFKWFPQWRSLKKVLSFSTFQIFFNILNYSYRNIDKLLIGKFIGLSPLGYYEKSYRLMMLPLENISNVINPVLHPMLSDFQNDIKFIKDKYLVLINFSAYIGFFLSVLLYFCAGEIVYILFGDQWSPSIPVFKILALSVGIQIIQSPIGAVFQATNHVRVMCLAGGGAFVITLLFIILGIYIGTLTELAACIVVAFYLTFVFYHSILFNVVFKETVWKFLFNLWRPLLVSGGVGFVLYLFESLTHIENHIVSLILKIVISLITFMCFSLCGFARFPIKLLINKFIG